MRVRSRKFQFLQGAITADSQEIPMACIFQLKLTAGKASEKIFPLLTVAEREVTKSDRSSQAATLELGLRSLLS